MRPLLLRPAFLGRGSRSDFSGVVQVISEKSETVWKRLPALVGLRCLTAIETFPFFSVGRPAQGVANRHRITTVPRVSIPRGMLPEPHEGPGRKRYSAACWLPKISIVSPGASVTTAFFQERVVPGVW